MTNGKEIEEVLLPICERKAVEVTVDMLTIARKAGNEIFQSIARIAGELTVTLTAEARRNVAPHPHRPDLRGNGMPRKRGKGKY